MAETLAVGDGRYCIDNSAERERESRVNIQQEVKLVGARVVAMVMVVVMVDACE